jgi:hypothetical protein
MDSLGYLRAAEKLAATDDLDYRTALMRLFLARLRERSWARALEEALKVAERHWAGEPQDLDRVRSNVWDHLRATFPLGDEMAYPEGKAARGLLSVLHQELEWEQMADTAEWFAITIDDENEWGSRAPAARKPVEGNYSHRGNTIDRWSGLRLRFVFGALLMTLGLGMIALGVTTSDGQVIASVGEWLVAGGAVAAILGAFLVTKPLFTFGATESNDSLRAYDGISRAATVSRTSDVVQSLLDLGARNSDIPASLPECFSLTLQADGVGLWEVSSRIPRQLGRIPWRLIREARCEMIHYGKSERVALVFDVVGATSGTSPTVTLPFIVGRDFRGIGSTRRKVAAQLAAESEALRVRLMTHEQ